jgi:hypothetical protein
LNPTLSRNAHVNAYIDALDEGIKALFVEIRETILEAEPDLEEAIKWKNCLTYSAGRNIIQTVVGKGKVSLIFFDGIDLDDPKRYLEGEGKRVRTYRILSEDFDRGALQGFVKHARRLAS